MRKILKYFGYIHKSEVEPDYMETLPDPKDIPELKDLEEQFFKDLANVDRIDMFLDATMFADMKREFNSSTDQERNLVKGHYALAGYLKKGIMKARGLLTK
jgi:hypothetical protein